MKALNKETAPKVQRLERIIQFGEGNFLRSEEHTSELQSRE